MASKVPFEIWLKISHYLPRAELQRLCALNSTFYCIAMDARYQEVALFESEWGIDKTLRKLDHLSQSHIACRVRHVKMNLLAAWENFPPLGPLLREYHSGYSILHWNTLRKNKKLLKATRKALASLSCLTQCDLTWRHDSTSRPIIPSLLSALGSNLRCLKFKSKLESLHSLLQSTPVHFPTLESVHIAFYRSPALSAPGKETFLTSIIRFLNHHSSLLSLAFSPAHFFIDPPVELSCFFNMLGYFPRLRHLGFYFGCLSDTHVQMSEPHIFTQFLKNHANQLQSIAIGFFLVSEGFLNRDRFLEYGDIPQSLFNIPFPNMLKLDTCQPMAWMESKYSIWKMILWFSDTLTTLTFMRHFSFTYQEVKTLTLYFRHRSADTGLKSLSLDVKLISPELIDLLASGFPGLTQLTLEAEVVKPWEPGHSLEVHDSSEELVMFELEMEQRIYDTWSLCHLDIQLSFYHHSSRVAEIIENRISNIQRLREG